MEFPTSSLSDSSDDDDLIEPTNHEDDSPGDRDDNPYQIDTNVITNSDSSESDGKDPLRVVSSGPYDKPLPRKRTFSASSTEEEIAAKKPYVYNERIDELVSKKVPSLEDNKGMAMLEKMGYRSGMGLGKKGQGRVEPVELSKQRGRRGLGLTVPELDPADLVWDGSLEVVEVKEKIEWLDDHLPSLELDDLRNWMEEGPENRDIENMTDFCNAQLVKNIIKGKNVFDHLNAEELFKARSRSNPFETLKSGMFLNRAALKMANMDAAFDFMFTNPKTEDGQPMVGPDDLLYFADVCAGPGGFSEYVLWRQGWRCKGFGFTLKRENDFKLGDFFAGTPETFEAYYGVKNDGDVYDPENIKSLTELVMRGTDSLGVHFMMADGGFNVAGEENIQELLSKQLYLCQCLVALSILRPEGHFVCKLFDLFSPFSAGLVYLMYRAFKSICIFKPNTSRPANSERYIICKHKRSDSGPIRDYLFEVNLRLHELKMHKIDVTHIVPSSVLMGDERFHEYLITSNNSLGERQIVNLMKITAFARDQNLIEIRQADLRKKCLAAWKVPDKPRAHDRTSADDARQRIIPHDREILALKPTNLGPSDLNKIFKSIYDWQCVPLGSTELNFYLGLGRNKVFKFNAKNYKWDRETVSAELNPGTLVYGEVVNELKGEGVGQYRMRALHILDGISIGYEDISALDYTERLRKLNLYCKALERVQGDSQCPVRTKDPHDFASINDIFRSLTYRHDKANQPMLVIENERYWLQPKAIVFMNTTKEPWTSYISTKTGFRYFFNAATGKTEYPNRIGRQASATVKECLQKLYLWKFEEGVGLKREGPVEGVLHKDALLEFINSVRRPIKREV